jgi:hypothetical protein
MTALALAELVQARQAGRGKWLAKCPAHNDRTPSLSICEGTDRRVLMRWWAGCELEAVLTALRTTDDNQEGNERTRLLGVACDRLRVVALAAETKRLAAKTPHERIA